MAPPGASAPLAASERPAPALNPPAQQLLSALTRLPAKSTALWQRLAVVPPAEPVMRVAKSRGAIHSEVYRKAVAATVLVVTEERRFGSGVMISDQGEVLTNWHVLQGAEQTVVFLKPEEGVQITQAAAFVATPVKVDPVADLALLRIQAPPAALTAVPLGNLSAVQVGQDVHTIGHPEGELWTYTTGIISQVRPDYRWEGQDDLPHQATILQTQTALNPGSSGGPLLNDRAELIGLSAFRKSGEGLNYAVAVDTIKAFLSRKDQAPNREGAALGPPPTVYGTESYGSAIVGVYSHAPVPPPDVWLVYRAPSASPAYAVRGQKSITQLDTLVQADDPQALTYYIDADCDGRVDLIGYGAAPQGVITRYARPPQPLYLVALAQELAEALERGTIPYSQVRLCR